MMQKLYSKAGKVLFLVLTMNLNAASPDYDITRVSGDIAGKVQICDGQNEQSGIQILGTSFGAITDAAGNFKINYVQPGTYTLTVIQKGYKIGTIPNVTVVSKQTVGVGTTDLCPDKDGDSYPVNTDCNDMVGAINPGANERCYDGIDNDCDGVADEGCSDPICTDADADGYPAQENCGNAVDCADGNSLVHPDADERCNQIDDNCNGIVDDNAIDQQTYYMDADGDGYGSNSATVDACVQPEGYVAVSGDCDDSLADVNPNGVEICNNIDDDCDGTIDEGVYQPVNNGTAECHAGEFVIVGGCDTGFDNCNRVFEDGCEVYLDLDPNNCGQCGNQCETGPLGQDAQCVAGLCTTWY